MKRLALALFAACGSSNAADHAGSGGGNVSFGGAQDFGEFRGILDRGDIPGPDTLDANGFFNEHYAPPPAATCGGALCMTPGVMVGRDWLTSAHQATLAISIATPIDPTTYTRKPLDMVVVVDHSGSMASDGRLEKVKGGLSTLIDNLTEGDRLAIVQFDDRVDVLTPFTSDRTQLHAIVGELTPRGSTDIFDGLEAGYKLAAQELSTERQHRVIFLSDGLATAGDTNRTDILAMSDSFAEQGVGLTTIGVGNEFDVELMRGLAEHGAGNFYFVEDPAAATEVFMQELDYFVTPIALGIDVQALAGSGWTFGEVVGSTMWHASPTVGSMHVPAAFIASRTSGDPNQGRRGGGSQLFIHLTPTGNNPDGKVAELTLSYRTPAGEAKSQKVTLQYLGAEEPASTYLSSDEMAPRFGMYNMFLGLRYAANQGATQCASAAVAATRGGAVAWNAMHENPDIAADLEVLDKYAANLRTRGITTPGTLATCSTATDPYGHDYGYGNDYEGGACSAGGSPGALALIGLAGLVAVRRRRL